MNPNEIAAKFQANRVTNPGQSEILRQTLYDFQLYATAGVTTLTFFSLPQGQGITSAIGATVGTAKTSADTNMELAGQLPSGKSFLIESIEVLFFPGTVNTANTYTTAPPIEFAAAAAATVEAGTTDVNTIYQSGVLELNILSKNYLRETPLLRFPPRAHFDLAAAVASNSATVGQITLATLRAGGRAYYIEPEIPIAPAMNFEVKILFPGAVATPSGFNGRIGVILDGYLLRASQ